jgi:hypothetical protein
MAIRIYRSSRFEEKQYIARNKNEAGVMMAVIIETPALLMKDSARFYRPILFV